MNISCSRPRKMVGHRSGLVIDGERYLQDDPNLLNLHYYSQDKDIEKFNSISVKINEQRHVYAVIWNERSAHVSGLNAVSLLRDEYIELGLYPNLDVLLDTIKEQAETALNSPIVSSVYLAHYTGKWSEETGRDWTDRVHIDLRKTPFPATEELKATWEKSLSLVSMLKPYDGECGSCPIWDGQRISKINERYLAYTNLYEG